MKPLKTLNDEQINETIYSTSTTTTVSPIDSTETPAVEGRIIQNFRLVYLDNNVDEPTDNDTDNTIAQLRQIVNNLIKFTDVDECIDFITNIKDEKLLLISSGQLDEMIVSVIHPMTQVDVIYIFCTNPAKYENWVKSWYKIQGVYTDIKQICETLQQVVKDCDHNTLSISFVKKIDGASKQHLDSLDKSFMYTQILKEILLTIEFDQVHVNEFLSYCRHLFIDNDSELRHINKIETEYFDHKPIWWYTYQCFLYSMLNRTLRLMETDIIIKMGFFLKDVHNHLVELHSEQFNGRDDSNSFTVYRGQGLSQTDFDQLQQTEGGLLSFNNFLSTSTNSTVSLRFVRRTITTSDSVGVLFVMQINPSVSTTPFANVKNVSSFKGEDEILFSMHSIFRIGQIKQLDGNTRLYQVDLTLTSDNDPQLHALTEQIRQETYPHLKGWYRLGELLIKLGEFDKAEQVCDILFEQTTDEREKRSIYHMLGMIKIDQGQYEDAVQYYEQSIRINQKFLSPTNPDLAASYNNLGLAYVNMGEYSKALSYYEETLEICRKTFPENHPGLATSYNNIGTVYKNMGEYSKALPYYEKALEICQKILPENHPSLAVSYNNIGLLYDNKGQYTKALSYYEKVLAISKKILPENHPDLATSYNNIGKGYYNMGAYSKALSYYEKAREIRQKSLSENHPDLAISYDNIGLVYMHLGEYSKALPYYEKALEIRQKAFPEYHPDLATSYNSIGGMYDEIGEYSKALSYYQKALEIGQKTLPENHPSLATSYNNIGGAYNNIGEYSKALSYYEKTLEIRQKALPENHPDLATSYNNTAGVYYNMGAYSKALSYYEKALAIWKETLPRNHPNLATSYNNIGTVYKNMREYSKSLSYYEKALEMRQQTLPENHPDLATSYDNIGLIYNNMGEYSKARSSHEKALEMRQQTLPENHPNLATSYNNIGGMYENMGEYSKALSYYEKALDIRQKTLLENHPGLATSYNNIAGVYYSMNEFMKALEYLERALHIYERSLPSGHPEIKNVKEGIEIVKKKL